MLSLHRPGRNCDLDDACNYRGAGKQIHDLYKERLPLDSAGARRLSPEAQARQNVTKLTNSMCPASRGVRLSVKVSTANDL